MNSIKEIWLQKLNDEGLKFFVLKATQFFEALSDEEVIVFNEMLRKLEYLRTSNGKTKYNNYYVVNRDDVPHIKSTSDFLKIVKAIKKEDDVKI